MLQHKKRMLIIKYIKKGGSQMKNIILFLSLIFVTLSLNAAYDTASQTLHKVYRETQSASDLVSSAQNLTTSWAALGSGSNVSVSGKKIAALYVVLDINNSSNARVRALGRHTTSGATYVMPIKTVAASDVKIEDEYYEFNVDEDQNMLLTWDLDGVVNYLDFQVQVSATGTTAGQIDDAHLVTGWK
jgi:hypothetical protein